MSGKVKFSSNSSTPIKTKLSENLSVSPSPTKGNKYKNFLASVLTPSQTKKWLKRKKSNKSENSFKGNKPEVEEVYKGSQVSDEFGEPAYSSIEELKSKRSSYQESVVDSSSALKSKRSSYQESVVDSSSALKSKRSSYQESVVDSSSALKSKRSSYQESVVDSSSALSTKLSDNTRESSSQVLSHQEQNSLTTSGEPLYAVVNKQRKNIDVNIKHKEEGSDQQQSNEKKLSERMVSSLANKNSDSSNKSLIEEQKEEIKLLVERMKELTVENRELHKNIERIIREEKWKEDSLHAELKLKITELEADTHKEVKCLTDQIKTLLTERKVLTDQIHILHEEKQLLQLKYEDACSKMKSMVSREFMKKVVEDHDKMLNQAQKKHLEDIKKMQRENEVTLESKISLMGEVEELKEKLNRLIAKQETLKNSEQELLQERNRILLQLEESKQMQQEAQNMLLSLLKITETISIERDVLINKASFQDHQQKLLQTSIVDYSLNMGRLQEHFSNLSREKLEELQKLKSGESQRDESLKNFYGRQLEMLRSKVLNQSNTINDLENEKNKLELQLESLWQAACMGKPKPEDEKYNISTLDS